MNKQLLVCSWYWGTSTATDALAALGLLGQGWKKSQEGLAYLRRLLIWITES
jgi:hypothetical protein